jgi:hypothetical protein
VGAQFIGSASGGAQLARDALAAGDGEDALDSRIRGQRRGDDSGEPRRGQRRLRRHGRSAKPRGARLEGGGRRRALYCER